MGKKGSLAGFGAVAGTGAKKSTDIGTDTSTNKVVEISKPTEPTGGQQATGRVGKKKPKRPQVSVYFNMDTIEALNAYVATLDEDEKKGAKSDLIETLVRRHFGLPEL